MKKCVWLWLMGSMVSFLCTGLQAQVPGGVDFFEYPLRIAPKLNANFGEMRNNHFHMGLDLATESRVNLPVYAPADGFVGRMKIELSGFGRAIYINHPNGTTTLYAHMNRFLPEAELFLKEQQYKQQSWKIDLTVPPALIPIKKGQLIGLSGNTGASQGPHVHFEIRDTETERCLNPLLYNLSVKDETPPDVLKLAFYNRDKSIYDQAPFLVPLVKKNGSYNAGDIRLPFERAMVAIQATDRITGFQNPNGIFSASIHHAGRMLSSFRLDNIGYDQTRGLNGHIDYLTRFKGGPYYQMLFPPKALGVEIYNGEGLQDHLDVPPAYEEFEIRVSDAHGNTTTVDFRLSGQPSQSVAPAKKNGLPMQPKHVNVYEDENIQFVFPEFTFYDAFHFQVKSIFANAPNVLSSVSQTLPENIPVNHHFTVRIKPNRNINLVNAERVVIRRTYRSKTELKRAVQEKGWFAAAFRDFGFFQLLEDNEPPSFGSNIQQRMQLRSGSRITVLPADNLQVIREVRLLADGQWLLLQQNWNGYSYTVDEHFPIGEHKLTVIVEDEAGNQTTREWIVNRN
jgi:Peptidase family M23